MKLMIGCPVYARDWILPAWFEATFKACEVAGISDPEFVFATDDDDDKTLEVISNNARACPLWFSSMPGPHRAERNWRLPERFQFMADLRNCLLDTVRIAEPEFFLSLDSDMLLHPEQLKNMLESIQNYDAVGGKAFMSPQPSGEDSKPDYDYPSFAMLTRDGGLRRENFYGVAKVDVIMAIKLMNRVAYNVDYVNDFRGEDIGWSIAVREFGLKIGWDGRVAAKHVMHPDELHRVDERVGF